MEPLNNEFQLLFKKGLEVYHKFYKSREKLENELLRNNFKNGISNN